MDHREPCRDVPVQTGRDTVRAAQELVQQMHDELRHLLLQRAEIMRRIGTAKKTIAGLAALFGEMVLSKDLRELMNRGPREQPSGLTRTCRAILMEADHALSAREVRDRMQERTPALVDRQKDPIASITTILNRLVDYGEAERVASGNKQRSWRWVVEPRGESNRANGSNFIP